MSTEYPKHIIPPVDRKLIKSELTADRYVRKTNKLENEVFIVNAHNAPNVMQEIGRLRELSFYASGGGTGNEVDIDKFDTGENCYEQLIIWSPKDEEIVSGYRFIDCSKIYNLDPIPLSTTHYFHFSDTFLKDYMPETIELGRSWVQPQYQPHINPRKGMFSLDNLWDGLGSIMVDNPNIKHFFGKVTMYTSYNQEARDAVLSFMHHYFPDKEKLVYPHKPLPYYGDPTNFIKTLEGLDFKEGLRELNRYVKERDELVPPLISNYMQLSSTMKTFGTAMNSDFGDVEETGILVSIGDVYEEKRERYIKPYLEEKASR